METNIKRRIESSLYQKTFSDIVLFYTVSLYQSLLMKLLLFLSLLLSPTLWAQDSYLYIGTYTTFTDGTPTGSEGIYMYKFNHLTGKLDSIGSTAGVVESPSFLAVSPHHLYLYCGSDTRTPGEGSVSAFDINKSNGKLTFINKQPSGGDNPIYVEVTPNNDMLLVANYAGGNFGMFKIVSNGSIGHQVDLKQLEGQGTNPDRQEQPHPHTITVVPGAPVILVTDLGTDRVLTYNYFSKSGLLIRETMDTTSGNILAGSGPRHAAFHPNGKYIYLVEEMGGTVAIISFIDGKMKLVKRLPLHEPQATGPFASADIHLSKDGKFLYASNRGQENNIVIFKVNGKNGNLTLVGYQSTLGTTPRNFTIDPTGNFLLVANQTSGSVVVFRIDHKTGLLTPTGESINVPQPTCLKMIWK